MKQIQILKDEEKVDIIMEIPPFALRAYALFFSRHGTAEEFKQNELEWILSESMRKKIFALLLIAGWIKKYDKDSYLCINPSEIFKRMLEFKFPEIIKKAKREYVFTELSSIEIWSDYSYVQRGIEKSPYFIKVLRKDLVYWRDFFNKYKIPSYIKEGSTIGEYVILIPVDKIIYEKKDGLNVESLKGTMKIAKENSFYLYAYNYMRRKYDRTSA